MRRRRSALERLTKRSRGVLWTVACGLALLLLASGLRLASMELTFPPRLLGDEIYYVEVAACTVRIDLDAADLEALRELGYVP